MPELIGPSAARQRLGARLREVRESRGLSIAEVERALDRHAPALNDVEAGTAVIPPLEVESVLRVCGVDDDGVASELMLLSHVARSTGWWGRHGLTNEYQRYAAHEGEAARIAVYQPLVVPGVLQTQRYARAATAAILNRPPDHAEVHARVQLRLERQRLVEDRVAAGDAPTLVAIIEEAVLRRPTGGADVMRDQLDHLLAQGRRPHVQLVVMPSDLGDHVGLGGVFELLDFAAEPDRAMVFVESLANDFLTRDDTVVALYRANVDRLLASGLTDSSALARVQEARDALA